MLISLIKVHGEHLIKRTYDYLSSRSSLVEYQVTDAYDYRYGSFTRTCWKFNENDHFTVDKDLITKGTVGSFVRCVRDVK